MGSSGRYGWKFKIDFALVNNSILVEVKAGLLVNLESLLLLHLEIISLKDTRSCFARKESAGNRY